MTSQRSFLNAVKWAYTATWGERVFTSLFTFVLAAMLGPRDFGIITIALIYLGFLEIFLDQGFVAALIQRKDLQPEHLDSVFWMNIALSLCLAMASVLCSGRWAALNHVPEVATILLVLSLCLPVEGLAVVQFTILKRNLDFRSLSLRANVSVLAGGVAGIALACAGFGVWALVWQQVVRSVSGAALLWSIGTWRPRLRFSWNHLRQLTRFSLSTFVAQLAVFVDQQTGAILLAMLFGPVAVGLYRLAERCVNTVVSTTVSAIQSVSLAQFSRVQERPRELRESVLTCLRLSCIVCLPALAGLAAASDTLMATLGPGWVVASDVVKVLSLAGGALMLSVFTAPLLQAVSKPHYDAVLQWARAVVSLVLLLAGASCVRHSSLRWQIMSIALARCATVFCFVAPVFLYILLRHTGIRFHQGLKTMVPSTIAALVIFGSLQLLQWSGWLAAIRPALSLAIQGVVGAMVGGTALLLCDAQLRTAIPAFFRERARPQAAAATSH